MGPVSGILRPVIGKRILGLSWLLLTAGLQPPLLGQDPAPAPTVVIRQAEGLLRDGLTEEAIALLEALQSSGEGSPRAMALLGAARYQNRQYLSAEVALRRAVEGEQLDLRTDYYLVSTLWENGKTDAAESQCLEALARHPRAVPLLHLLGRLYLWQGRYPEAAMWIERGVEGSPDSLDLWLDLAGALEGAGDLEKALEAYRRAVVLAPEHYQVRYGMARALQRLGDQEGARRELERYQELLAQDQSQTREEGWLQSQIDYGLELIRQGETAAAIDHLSGLPRTGDVWVALAEAHLQAGDLAESLTALERAVAREPDRQDLRERLTAARLSRDESP